MRGHCGGCALLIVIAAASNVAAQAADTGAGAQQMVRLDRAGCPGCPSYTITISSPNQLQFTYRGFRPRVTAHDTLHLGDVRSATADSQQVAALFRQIDQTGFFDIASNRTMQGPNCHAPMPDMSSTMVSVTMGTRQHAVSQYGGCGDVPVALKAIEDSIDKIANVGRWLDAHP